jgi:hypothetical protein
LVLSQTTLLVTGTLDFWIRPDGNDQTGDGTANDPSKAFRTIAGCWAAVGNKYASTPSLNIAMKLGIPGDYEGASLGPFGGSITITGDPGSPAAYRIVSIQAGTFAFALMVSQCSLGLSGVNLVMNQAANNPNANSCLRTGKTSVNWLNNCQLTLEASSPTGVFMFLESSSQMHCANGVTVVFEGNGNSTREGIIMNTATTSYGTGGGGPPSNWIWRNISFTNNSHNISDQAVYRLGNMIQNISNTTGKKYNVQTNGILDCAGQPMPGSTPGSVGTQGQVFP